MNWNIKLTLRKALRIQSEQLDYYCNEYPFGSTIRTEIANRTNVEGLDLDEELPAHVVNRHAPRGGAIEALWYREREKQQRDRASLRLETAHSQPISEALEDLPDDLALWTEERLQPLGTRITALVFQSDDPESRYYGKNWVVTAVNAKRPENHTTDFHHSFDDFGAALLRA